MGLFQNKNTPEYNIQNQINVKLNYINEVYTSIGRYVKLNLADQINDESIHSMIVQIDNALKDLVVLNEELNHARGLKTCENCHKTIAYNVAFCPECGALQPNIPQPMGNQGGFVQPPQSQIPQPPVVPMQVIHTPQPAVIPERVAETPPQPAVIPEQVAETPPQQTANNQNYIFCSECGNKEEAGVLFCSECGHRMD